MEKTEFLENKLNMCIAFESDCKRCDLGMANNLQCGELMQRYPRIAQAIVEKWMGKER